MKMRRSLSVKMSLSDGSGFEDKVKEAKQKWSACAEKRRRADILDKGCCNMVGGRLLRKAVQRVGVMGS